MSVKILFFDTKPYDQQFFDLANQHYGFEIKYMAGRLNQDTAVFAKGFPAVCAFVNDVIDGPTLDALAASGVRLIALRCAGYNNVDLKKAYGRIHVVRVPGYSPHAVAEHAVALMMTLNRKTHRAYNRTREGNFSIQGLLGQDLFGKTAGIIGTGKIGRCMISILKGFGMRVLAYDRFPDAAYAASEGIEYVELPGLYRYSDVISLHCPLIPETHHLINRETIRQMKEGVVIINTGRGGLVNTRDLIEGLKSRKIGAAGLDVYEEEGDYFFEDFSAGVIDDDILARLMTFPNVLITSHQGFFTQEALANIAQTTLENIKVFAGENILNHEICYRCDGECTKKTSGRCF